MPSKALLQKVSALSHKKFRDELELFVAEGDKLVSEILNSTFKVEHLFVTKDSALAEIQNPRKEIINDVDMKRISNLKTPAHSLAVIKIPRHTLNSDSFTHKLTLALDEIQDPGNLGTIIRLADWFGISNIVCSPNTADCYSPKVVQATMGAIARVNVYYTDLTSFIQSTPRDIVTYGTFLNGENIYECKLSSSGIIVMGNEGKGISTEVESLIQQRLHIPSFNESEKRSESLNVAIATAICCSEFRRKSS